MAAPNALRPTREWPLFILAVALVLAVCVPLWQATLDPDEGGTGAQWSRARLARLFLGPEQIATYACLVFALFILAGRWSEVRRQRRAFSLDLLPVGQVVLVDDARDLQRRIDDRAGPGGPYLLASMLRVALGKFATSKSSRDVAEIVRTQADLSLSRLVTSMATVHYLAWAIPSIGFLGTVRGLAGSLTVDSTEESALKRFIKDATGHLNVAFDCTLVALAASLVLMFLVHGMQRQEEELVIDCQQYALDHLVSRLYELEPESHALDPADLDRRATA
ncbi:MAG: MotA/TolQ/ExbB proton channel family protein [Gemmataceae bacterium]|nr:MotA/TolQ/ExbB proton channel family protein [Gemmataceae bacterium]